MVNLIQTKGVRGASRHIMLQVFIGLLVFEAFTQADHNPELIELKLRYESLKRSYKLLCNEYSNLAKNCSAPPINCTKCPDDWFQAGDHCFSLHTDRHNWSHSAHLCEEAGGKLAILATKEEHEAVEKESKKFVTIYTNYWIGLTDIELEGEWKWVDNSSLTNAFWDLSKSEPDDNKSGGPEGEDCAVVDSKSHHWYDVPCSFSYPRICQRDTIPIHWHPDTHTHNCRGSPHE